MGHNKSYENEVDELIKKYTKRLENNMQRKKQILSGSEMLAYLHKEKRYPYKEKLDIESYEMTMESLQFELVKAQYWILKTGQKVAVVFEGRDAAGKGGTIQRFTMNLNPRHVHHVALAKPTTREQNQWYFQRYIPHLPTAGEISFFDRSWYNRACVEPVMGYCTETQYEEFMNSVVELEKQWCTSGIILVKYWLSIDQLEQLRRFRRRQTSDLRRWKLSPNDIDSLDKWDDYTRAIQALFKRTSHQAAPWYQIDNDDKKRGRITCISHFLSLLDYPDKNEKLLKNIDDKLIKKRDTID